VEHRPDPNSPDPVERNDAYNAKLESIGLDPLEGIRKHIARQKTMIKWIIISICADALLTGVAIVGVLRANEAAAQANHVASATHINCLAANEGRATETHLWNFILSFPPDTVGKTPAQIEAQQTQIDQFKAYIATNLAPRDCDTIGP
jgi:hypothetical protein